jgi:hypothetical protein
MWKVILKRSPTDQFAFLLVFGPVDLSAGEASIKYGERCVASSARRPIGDPNNNGGQPHEKDQQDNDRAHTNHLTQVDIAFTISANPPEGESPKASALRLIAGNARCGA